MGCEAAGFGGDLGIDLVHGSVAVFENVVLVVEFSEALGQGQLVSVALVNPEGELPRREVAGEHAACEGSGGGFLTGLAADGIEGEAKFVESCGKQVVDVVVRFGARAGGEDAKAGGVESGDERVTGGIDDFARADLPRAPEGVDEEAITIKRTRAQAFVLSDWLYQVMFQSDGLEGIVHDRAVWSPICAISGTLDKTLSELIMADYGPRLEAAEERLRADLYGGADDTRPGHDRRTTSAPDRAGNSGEPR